MKLYMGGKLKISGDVMASQKLGAPAEDRSEAALDGDPKKRGGAAARGPAAAAPAAAAGKMASDIVFTAIEDHVARNPELVGRRCRASSVFKLTAPDSAWTIDVKNGKGSCVRGTAEKPDMHARADRRGLPRDDRAVKAELR